MNTSKNTWNWLFWSIVLFQFASFGLLKSETESDCFTSLGLMSHLNGGPVAEGKVLPSFGVVNFQGQRQTIGTGQEQTLIFRNDCTCDDHKVQQWIENSHHRNEKFVIMLPVDPLKLPNPTWKYATKADLRAMRLSEMIRIGVPQDKLPLMIRLSPDNVVLSIETI